MVLGIMLLDKWEGCKMGKLIRDKIAAEEIRKGVTCKDLNESACNHGLGSCGRFIRPYEECVNKKFSEWRRAT